MGCETIQIFTASNKSWYRPPIDETKTDSFKKKLDEYEISPLVIHLFYLPNIASPDRKLLERSRQALIKELNRSSKLGAAYLVLHPGAYREATAKEGLRTVASSLDYVIAKSPGNKVKILIENTAGSGTQLGSEFVEIAEIFSLTRQTYPLGICLDTAHAFQNGYPIDTKQGLQSTLDEFDRLIGLEKLHLLHLNDSKTPAGSKVDRHWHIGKGKIGVDAFERIINHPMLKHLPAIMETPKAP
ncbi:deoxyribonuclease IV, partial [candidate division WOR-3 bacterium]|nr:deoxyribonuclease IV [candidate division WOR-3 bacterium]